MVDDWREASWTAAALRRFRARLALIHQPQAPGLAQSKTWRTTLLLGFLSSVLCPPAFAQYAIDWFNVTAGVQDNGTNKTSIINPPTGHRFYRLHKP